MTLIKSLIVIVIDDLVFFSNSVFSHTLEKSIPFLPQILATLILN